jgi:hypothetical protein
MCAHVGAASVSLLLHSRASGAEVASAFACTDTQGTTPLVAAGAYDATLTLRAADGTTLATAPTQANVTIDAGQVAALAPFMFAVDARGKLVVSFAALSTSANCTSATAGGAGINGSFFTLQRATGGCARVTFVRSRKGASLGTYTVDCSASVITSCIERDETFTVDGLESGPYTIHVGGLIGSVRCWAADDVLSVPAGASLVKAIELEPQGC